MIVCVCYEPFPIVVLHNTYYNLCTFITSKYMVINSETKLFLGMLLATVAVIGGAVFFFSRPTNAPKIDASLLAPADSHKIGSPSAAVILVEFGDFQCPACGAYHKVVKELQNRHKDTLALVFRHFPLSSHQNAMPAARAVEAAASQGKFWEMYNKVYENQNEWSKEKDPWAIFDTYAKDLGINVEQLRKDVSSEVVQKRIDRDMADALRLGINATPTFFINNERIKNPPSLEEFDKLIAAAIAKAPQPSTANESAYHIHANIRVVIDGKPVDFSQAQYQSTTAQELNSNIHFHDGIGNVFHVHKKGMLLRDLFSSFGMTLSGKPLAMYVNGKLNSLNEAYEPQDLDRILIVSGGNVSDTALQTHIAAVPDDACIYSEKCPERGTPPTEECVGGLGTDCK